MACVHMTKSLAGPCNGIIGLEKGVGSLIPDFLSHKRVRRLLFSECSCLINVLSYYLHFLEKKKLVKKKGGSLSISSMPLKIVICSVSF